MPQPSHAESKMAPRGGRNEVAHARGEGGREGTVTEKRKGICMFFLQVVGGFGG